MLPELIGKTPTAKRFHRMFRVYTGVGTKLPWSAVLTVQTKLIIFGLLILATTMEVSGDAIIRMGLAKSALSTKWFYFAAGASLLFGYGLSLNLAPIEFHRVVGIYIATLFVVWQIVSFVAFRSLPTLPILVGGSLIIAGGMIVAFWQQAGLQP